MEELKLAPTIRTYIENHMKEHKYKLQQFSEVTGVNVGTLSAIIKGNRSISMNQLDQITSGMGLEQGYFYEMYSVECFVEVTPHWRRLEPFLYNCAELNKLNCIKKVVIQVTDDRSYIDELFKVAEDFYRKEFEQAALILYECVADCEKYQHSERLALCQYRIFLINKTLNKFNNLNAAIRLEPYVEKLNEEIQLDAIKELANVYNALNIWGKVYSLSEELERKSDFQLKDESLRRNKGQRAAFYPIFTYKAYANLLKASVFEARKEYELALKYTEVYEKVIDIPNPTKEEIEIIERFRIWAQGNRLSINLMSGNHEVIHSYLQYLEDNPKEILTAFINIVQVANEHSLNIDFALEKFEAQIQQFHIDFHLKGEDNPQIGIHRFLLFNYEFAKYRLSQRNFQSGIDTLLYTLRLSSSSQDDYLTIKCIDLYGEYRDHADLEQQKVYFQLIEEISFQKLRV